MVMSAHDHERASMAMYVPAARSRSLSLSLPPSLPPSLSLPLSLSLPVSLSHVWANLPPRLLCGPSTRPCRNKGVSVSPSGVSFSPSGVSLAGSFSPGYLTSLYRVQHQALLHLAWAPRLHRRRRRDRSSWQRRWSPVQPPVQALPPAARAARPPRPHLRVRPHLRLWRFRSNL